MTKYLMALRKEHLLDMWLLWHVLLSGLGFRWSFETMFQVKELNKYSVPKTLLNNQNFSSIMLLTNK